MAIEVLGLQKRYGDLMAVDDVSFTVREGEFFGILGPNGAGKTTTLEMVEGLRRPDAGSARLTTTASSTSQSATRTGTGWSEEVSASTCAVS